MARDDAHVDLDRLVAAHALELALLQHAQELDLHLQRQVADLVEEQRAAVGELEAALPPRHGAGERALLVAEQLALEEPGASAAQLTRTNGLASRGAVEWMACATSSLPVPVSPRSSTVDCVGATCSTLASTSRSGARSPTMSPKLNSPCASRDRIPAYWRSCSARRRFSRMQVEALDRVDENAAQLLGCPTAW